MKAFIADKLPGWLPEKAVARAAALPQEGSMGHRLKTLVLGITLLAAGSGCSIDFDVLPDTFVAAGSPFVVRGTATVVDNEGPCLAWIGENGVTYHLFQDPRVDNETFDRVTTPGVTSRLQIAVRTDLELACQIGTIVEVRNVLEVVE